MSRGQLVGTTGQRVRADGGKEVLMEGQENWGGWAGQTVEDTEWGRQAKGQWRSKEQAVVRREWSGGEEQDKDKVDRDKVHDRGWTRPEAWEKGSPCCSLLCLVTLLLPFIVS